MSRSHFWLGRGFSSPQCVASVRAPFSRIPQSGTGLTPPGRTNPSQVFHVRVVCVAFAMILCIAYHSGARPLVMDTLIYSHTTKKLYHDFWARSQIRHPTLRASPLEFFASRDQSEQVTNGLHHRVSITN